MVVVAWGVGVRVGPFWAGKRLGGGGRGGSGGGDAFGGMVLLGVALTVGAGLWVGVAVLWAVVLGVLGLVDLGFAGGRWLWRWRSPQHRAESSGAVLRWAAVRWLWAAQVTRWIYWWRVLWARRVARRAQCSAYELAVNRRANVGATGIWFMFLGVVVGAVLWLGWKLSVAGAAKRGEVWEIPGWFWEAWWVCGVGVVVGVALYAWQGFMRMPLPDWVPVPVAVAEAEAADSPPVVKSAGDESWRAAWAAEKEAVRMFKK